ncbi:MAG TPA: hypothetical protein VD846_07950 [Allosphingosinicella sp.]|nr:hypothetical protein [Allosphingosinicella sp.]
MRGRIVAAATTVALIGATSLILPEPGAAQKSGVVREAVKRIRTPPPRPKLPELERSPLKQPPAEIVRQIGPLAGLGEKRAEQRARGFLATRDLLVQGPWKQLTTLRRGGQATLLHRFQLRRASPYLDRPAPAHPDGYVYPFLLASREARPSASEMVHGPRISPAVAVLNALPSGRAEYQRVFGRRTVSASSTAQMRSAASILRTGVKGVQALDTAMDFHAALMGFREDIVVILGHNEGGALRTLSGQLLNLKEASERCVAFGKLCIFLTCQSAKYLRAKGLGVARDLSIVEGARLAREIGQTLAREPLRRAEPRYSREAITNLDGMPLVLADPHAAMTRLSYVIGGGNRTLYVGIKSGTIFVVLAVIVTGVDERSS